MIVLDTSILSELIKPTPDANVERWVADQPVASLFISAITEAELRYGIAILPVGKRRTILCDTIAAILEIEFRGQILPFDSGAAIHFAEIASHRRKLGRPIMQADAQIAAIALSRGAALATRNQADFEACGLTIINPWNRQPMRSPN